jgi:hypothetical protein
MFVQARALTEEGMSAYTWIGSYHAPPATVSGSIRRDMCLVDSAVGVGELAVADHRGSQLAPAELARIAAEARVGGMLSGKVRCTAANSFWELLRAWFGVRRGQPPLRRLIRALASWSLERYT